MNVQISEAALAYLRKKGADTISVVYDIPGISESIAVEASVQIGPPKMQARYQKIPVGEITVYVDSIIEVKDVLEIDVNRIFGFYRFVVSGYRIA